MTSVVSACTAPADSSSPNTLARTSCFTCIVSLHISRSKNVIPDACRDVAGSNCAQFSRGRRAGGNRVGAARAEDTARGRIHRAGQVALEHDAPSLAIEAGLEDGGEQGLGVWVLRRP